MGSYEDFVAMIEKSHSVPSLLEKVRQHFPGGVSGKNGWPPIHLGLADAFEAAAGWTTDPRNEAFAKCESAAGCFDTVFARPMFVGELAVPAPTLGTARDYHRPFGRLPSTPGEWIVADLLARAVPGTTDSYFVEGSSVSTSVAFAVDRHRAQAGTVLRLTVELFRLPESGNARGCLFPDLLSDPFKLALANFPVCPPGEDQPQFPTDLPAAVRRCWEVTDFSKTYSARWSLSTFERTGTSSFWPGELSGPSIEAAMLCALLAAKDSLPGILPEGDTGALRDLDLVSARVAWTDPFGPLSPDDILKLRLLDVGDVDVKRKAAGKEMRVWTARPEAKSGKKNGAAARDGAEPLPLEAATVGEILEYLRVRSVWMREYAATIKTDWEDRWLDGTGVWQPEPVATQEDVERTGNLSPEET